MLRELSGKAESYGRLNFAAGKRGALVVSCETDSLGGEAVEGVVDEGVHDGHGSSRDSVSGWTCLSTL